jgi:hypothetical protein
MPLVEKYHAIRHTQEGATCEKTISVRTRVIRLTPPLLLPLPRLPRRDRLAGKKGVLICRSPALTPAAGLPRSVAPADFATTGGRRPWRVSRGRTPGRRWLRPARNHRLCNPVNPPPSPPEWPAWGRTKNPGKRLDGGRLKESQRQSRCVLRAESGPLATTPATKPASPRRHKSDTETGHLSSRHKGDTGKTGDTRRHRIFFPLLHKDAK